MNLSKSYYCVLFLICFTGMTAAQIHAVDTTARYLLFSHINAWTMHNADAIDDIFNENAVYEDVAYGAVMHGRDEIKNFLRETFNDIPDFKVKIVNWFSCGDRLSCEWIMSGTLSEDSADQEAAGKSFSVRGTSVARIKDGKFERWTDYYDK